MGTGDRRLSRNKAGKEATSEDEAKGAEANVDEAEGGEPKAEVRGAVQWAQGRPGEVSDISALR